MQPTVRTYWQWRVTKATKFKFEELMLEYNQVDENSDDAEALREMVRSLPGYPHHLPADEDIELVVMDIQH